MRRWSRTRRGPRVASPVCPYTCQAKGCGKACKAAPDDTLALLGLCRDCAAKRFKAGKAEQRKAADG